MKKQTEIKMYSWKKSVWKGIKQILIFGIPYLAAWLVQFHPEVSSLTIGTILNIVFNYLKNKG